MPIIIMKQILYLTIAIAALGLYACDNDNEPDAPEIPLEVLPSDLNALKTIHNYLDVRSSDYPVQWSLDDKSTWKNAGIELDTIIDEETRIKYLTVSSITLYMLEGYNLPYELLNLTNLKDLKIYGGPKSRFDGRLIPPSVKSLLVDRFNLDDPRYIDGVYSLPFFAVVLGNYKNVFDRIVIHGLAARRIDFRVSPDASLVDISHNRFEGEIGIDLADLKYLKTPANLSYNRFTGVYPDWNLWKEFRAIPILRNNLIEEIPQEVLQSDFWKEYHENFIGNPGYVAPQP